MLTVGPRLFSRREAKVLGELAGVPECYALLVLDPGLRRDGAFGYMTPPCTQVPVGVRLPGIITSERLRPETSHVGPSVNVHVHSAAEAAHRQEGVELDCSLFSSEGGPKALVALRVRDSA